MSSYQTQTEEEEGGGCLIATAAYGSELAPQVQLLREIRDNQLMNTESGSAFMSTFNEAYYSFSPTIADMERESPSLQRDCKTWFDTNALNFGNHGEVQNLSQKSWDLDCQ